MKPTDLYYDAQSRLTRLTMPAEARMPSGHYYVRGAISWPTLAADSAEGAFLVGAQEPVSKRVWVLAETAFIAVDVDSLDTFAVLWRDWKCDTFYHRSPEEEQKRYMLEVMRANYITHKPHFIRAPADSDSDALAVLTSAHQTGAFKAPLNGLLWTAWTTYNLRQRDTLPGQSLAHGSMPAALRAATALCIGHKRYPYRPPVKQDEEEDE